MNYGNEPPLLLKESTSPKLLLKDSTMRPLDSAELAKMLGAIPAPASVGGSKGPITLFAVRQELYRQLQSTNVAPAAPVRVPQHVEPPSISDSKAEPPDELTTSPLPPLRRLVVTVNEQEVVITGRVPECRNKQLAQEPIGDQPSPSECDTASKIPMSDDQWKRVEQLAIAIARPGFSPSPGQVASVLLSFALDSLGSDAVKELAKSTA